MGKIKNLLIIAEEKHILTEEEYQRLQEHQAEVIEDDWINKVLEQAERSDMEDKPADREEADS